MNVPALPLMFFFSCKVQSSTPHCIQFSSLLLHRPVIVPQSLSFMTLTSAKRTGQVIFRTSLDLDLSAVFSWLERACAFLVKNLPEVLFYPSQCIKRGVHVHIPHYWYCHLRSFGSGGVCWVSPPISPFFFFSRIIFDAVWNRVPALPWSWWKQMFPSTFQHLYTSKCNQAQHPKGLFFF